MIGSGPGNHITEIEVEAEVDDDKILEGHHGK